MGERVKVSEREGEMKKREEREGRLMDRSRQDIDKRRVDDVRVMGKNIMTGRARGIKVDKADWKEGNN